MKKNLLIDDSVDVRLVQQDKMFVKIGRRIREGCCPAELLMDLQDEYITKHCRA
jgi:hypothetical protein